MAYDDERPVIMGTLALVRNQFYAAAVGDAGRIGRKVKPADDDARPGAKNC